MVLVQYTVGLHIVFQDFGKGSFVLLLDTFRPPCHPWHTLQKKKQDDSTSPHHPHTILPSYNNIDSRAFTTVLLLQS